MHGEIRISLDFATTRRFISDDNLGRFRNGRAATGKVLCDKSSLHTVCATVGTLQSGKAHQTMTKYAILVAVVFVAIKTRGSRLQA